MTHGLFRVGSVEGDDLNEEVVTKESVPVSVIRMQTGTAQEIRRIIVFVIHVDGETSILSLCPWAGKSEARIPRGRSVFFTLTLSGLSLWIPRTVTAASVRVPLNYM